MPMCPENEVEEKLKAKMGASTYREDGIFAKELEDELMKFTVNSEENKVDAHPVGQSEKAHRNDVEVNITECTKSGGSGLVEAECQDTTESSSSFDDCDYGVENDDTWGNSEALSDVHGDAASALGFDGFGDMLRMRRKRPTTHWRSFIQPLRWRCKWVELQMKKLEEQAQKYERKLEECSQQKQVQLEKSEVEGLGMKSLPFPHNYARSEVLRRKKRRRDELTKDTAAYMSHHNLFSYYENRKHFTEGAFMDSEFKNPAIDDELGGNDELSCVEARNRDNFLEHIYQKIESLRAQVGKLKTRVDKVTSENAGSTYNLNVPISYNDMIASAPNTAAPSNNGDRMTVGSYIASQLMSEYNMGDALIPESAVRSHREVFPDVNRTTDHAYFADAYGNGDDEVLIDNHRVKEEMNSFEEVKIQPTQRPLALKDGLNITSLSAMAEPDPPTDDQPPQKVRSISKLTAPKSQSKRGRKRGAG